MKLKPASIFLVAGILLILFATCQYIRTQAAGVIVVPVGGDLQAAINSAQPGDTIVLQAGATYTFTEGENFVFPDKGPGTAVITIQSSAPLLAGRVSPANASQLAKIVTNKQTAAIFFPKYSHHWRFVGIAVTNGGTQFVNNLVEGASYNPAQSQPHNIEFDRCLMYPKEVEGVAINPHPQHVNTAARAIAINGSEITVKNSYLYGFAGFYPGGTELTVSECILTDVGTGPYHIVNNYLEAHYAQVFIGGADPDTPNVATVTNATMTSATFSQVANLRVGDLFAVQTTLGDGRTMASGRVTAISGNQVTYSPLRLFPGTLATTVPEGALALWNGVVPSNIEIRGNTFYKPPVWKTWGMGNPKGVFEFKNAINVTVDGNIFDGVGGVMAFTARNQGSAAPWSRFENITISNNLVKEFCPIYLTFLDDLRINQNGHTARIFNNLFLATGVRDGAQLFLKLNDGADVQAYNNTVLQGGNIVVTDSQRSTHQTPGFVFRDNIIKYGPYGYQCLEGLNNARIDCWPDWIRKNNVVIDDLNTEAAPYFPGDFFAPTVAAVNLSGDYRLAASSPYKGRGSDGKDPGVDIDKLLAALGGAIVPPTPTPSPTPTPAPTPTPVPVKPPLKPCAVGEWCYFAWPSTQDQKTAALNNALAYGCGGPWIQTGSYLYCVRVR